MSDVPNHKSGSKSRRAAGNAEGTLRKKTGKRGRERATNDKNFALLSRIVAHVNQKRWWHVPPRDPEAYRKRGKFLASSYREAEFWGSPSDMPQKVCITQPLIGDEATIEKKLFGKCISDESIEMEDRFKLDAKIKRAALAKGYDSIVLMAPKGFEKFKRTGKAPRSVELNLLRHW